MRLLASAFLLASCFSFGADKDFNGRWDITVENEARKRAWWLEVTGAGTPQVAGRFVGAPGGDMNTIPEIAVKNGELRFVFERQYRRDPDRKKTSKGIYTARLVNGKLTGEFRTEDNSAPRLKFTGVRAPVINEKDDGTWREGKPVKLFNGKDLTGWKSRLDGEPKGWSVVNGVLASTGKGIDIVTVQSFWNFIFKTDFRVAPKSNSGIGLRGRYEVQILEDYGRTPDTHTNGALYSRIVPSMNASKPANEWQTYEIRLVGSDVTVVLNGKKVIDKKEIEGLTAIATDPNEGEPGPLILQGDHGPVEFRNMVLIPLTK